MTASAHSGRTSTPTVTAIDVALMTFSEFGRRPARECLARHRSRQRRADVCDGWQRQGWHLRRHAEPDRPRQRQPEACSKISGRSMPQCSRTGSASTRRASFPAAPIRHCRCSAPNFAYSFLLFPLAPVPTGAPLLRPTETAPYRWWRALACHSKERQAKARHHRCNASAKQSKHTTRRITLPSPA